MDRIPQKTNPKMFDLAVLPIQRALAANLPWLDHAIGICEQLTDIKNKLMDGLIGKALETSRPLAETMRRAYEGVEE